MSFKRLLRWLSTLVSVLAVAAMVLVLFWTAQPSDVLQVNNDPLPVRPTEVTADGGVVVMTIDFCKKRKVTGHARVYLVGENKGQKPELAWPADNIEPQCLKNFDVRVPIPASAQTDVYHIVFEITYKVNPLKDQVAIFRTRSFKVVNTKLQPGDAKPVPVQ